MREWVYGNKATDGRVSDPAAACYSVVGLQQLWLVVHYSSPGVFVEPLTELHIEIGYGDHRHQSQRTAAIQLRNIANEIGCGPFDRIYFLVDCQPDPFSELIQSS